MAYSEHLLEKTGMRLNERIIAVYFAYVAVLAAAWPLTGAMRARVLLASVAVYATWGAVRWARLWWWEYFRDWWALACVLVAYKQMGWFAPASHTYELEKGWVAWDRMILLDWGGRALIESMGSVVPAVLDASYLLVYAVGPFCILMLYALKLSYRTGDFLALYVLGNFLSFGQFPFWPSEPPWTVFPGDAAPQVHTVVRDGVQLLLGTQGIHTSVFPSAHVSGAFAGAFAMSRIGVPRGLAYGLLVYATLVATATVYGRYHYAVDAAAGFVMAVVALGILVTLERIQRHPLNSR
jgi:membrane-associated phospholipid phosphatase